MAHPGHNNSPSQTSCSQRHTFQTLSVQNSWLIFSQPRPKRSDTCNLLCCSIWYSHPYGWDLIVELLGIHTHKETAGVHIKESLVEVCIGYQEFDGA